jgi:hypothetical protein
MSSPTAASALVRRPRIAVTSPRALQLLLTATLALGFAVVGPRLEGRFEQPTTFVHSHPALAPATEPLVQSSEIVPTLPSAVRPDVHALPAIAPRSERIQAVPAVASFAIENTGATTR